MAEPPKHFEITSRPPEPKKNEPEKKGEDKK
jgi:hypothetical protein